MSISTNAPMSIGKGAEWSRGGKANSSHFTDKVVKDCPDRTLVLPDESAKIFSELEKTGIPDTGLGECAIRCRFAIGPIHYWVAG